MRRSFFTTCELMAWQFEVAHQVNYFASACSVFPQLLSAQSWCDEIWANISAVSHTDGWKSNFFRLLQSEITPSSYTVSVTLSSWISVCITVQLIYSYICNFVNIAGTLSDQSLFSQHNWFKREASCINVATKSNHMEFLKHCSNIVIIVLLHGRMTQMYTYLK